MRKNLFGRKMKSNVSRLMNERRFSVRALVASTGLAIQTVMNARDDTKILTCGLGTLQLIAKALGVRVCDLFEEE